MGRAPVAGKRRHHGVGLTATTGPVASGVLRELRTHLLGTCRETAPRPRAPGRTVRLGWDGCSKCESGFGL